MTWDELNKKYPEERDEMSVDREREYLKDLYDAYETIGFVNKFWTPFDLGRCPQICWTNIPDQWTNTTRY